MKLAMFILGFICGAVAVMVYACLVAASDR